MTSEQKPKALDLFCKAGGASMGLYQAGFDVTGVDIEPQPRYPFRFIQANVATVVANQSRGDFLGEFDFVWASPPCQFYTQMLNHGRTPRTNHPDMVAWIRKALPYLAPAWAIENVWGAPLLNPILLCGEMFNLRVMRHRLFETSWQMLQPYHPPHRKEGGIRKHGDGGYYFRVYGHETGKAEWGSAMGIDWMKSPELAQAIPPAYSKYIGEFALQHIRRVAKEPVIEGRDPAECEPQRTNL